MVEGNNRKPNHAEIAAEIIKRSFGEIFTWTLPNDTEFTAEDFQIILEILKPIFGVADINTSDEDLEIIASFAIGKEGTTLIIYKDSAMNTSLCMGARELIQEKLKTYPKLYPSILNYLRSLLPQNERKEFPVLEIDPKAPYFIMSSIRELPVSVIKALIRLIDNPTNPSK